MDTLLIRASQEEKTINRPIIFVGHSFGGIVAEKVDASVRGTPRQCD
jgi:surfactin synthase thioesterase subunit